MRIRRKKPKHTISSTLHTIESVEDELKSLLIYQEDTENLYVARNEYLQLFTGLAMNIHQSNTLKFLTDGKLAEDVFPRELITAKAKNLEFQYQIRNAIESAMDNYRKHRDKIMINEHRLLSILQALDSKSMNSKSFIELVSNDHQRKQALTLAIENTRHKIIFPVVKLIADELAMGDKILDVIITNTANKGYEKYSNDELARICEMASMGLEIPGFFDEMDNIFKTSGLHDEILILKPHGIIEEMEMELDGPEYV